MKMVTEVSVCCEYCYNAEQRRGVRKIYNYIFTKNFAEKFKSILERKMHSLKCKISFKQKKYILIRFNYNPYIEVVSSEDDLYIALSKVALDMQEQVISWDKFEQLMKEKTEQLMKDSYLGKDNDGGIPMYVDYQTGKGEDEHEIRIYPKDYGNQGEKSL